MICCIPADTWQHWRVLLADSDARTKDVTIGANCEVAAAGPRRRVAHQPPKELPDRQSTSPARHAPTWLFAAAPIRPSVSVTTVVANIAIGGASDPAPHPYGADGVSPWSAARPAYLRDLRRADRQLRTHQHGSAHRQRSQVRCRHSGLHPRRRDAVQEWSIKGASTTRSTCISITSRPSWMRRRLRGRRVLRHLGSQLLGAVRSAATSRATPYQGRTIMHCHILTHEDEGAMTWMNVLGGTPPPTLPSGHGYSEYYPLSVTPATSVDVGSVSVATVNIGQGAKVGEATIQVVDNLGNPVAGGTSDRRLHRYVHRNRSERRCHGRQRLHRHPNGDVCQRQGFDHVLCHECDAPNVDRLDREHLR